MAALSAELRAVEGARRSLAAEIEALREMREEEQELARAIEAELRDTKQTLREGQVSHCEECKSATAARMLCIAAHVVWGGAVSLRPRPARRVTVIPIPVCV